MSKDPKSLIDVWRLPEHIVDETLDLARYLISKGYGRIAAIDLAVEYSKVGGIRFVNVDYLRNMFQTYVIHSRDTITLIKNGK